MDKKPLIPLKYDRYFSRRSHARARLKERYGLDLTKSEYDELVLSVNRSPLFRGTNIGKVKFKGVDIFFTLRNNAISTFLDPEQARISIQQGLKHTKPPQSLPIVTLEEMFKTK